jgi:hypothetical protein
MLISLLHELVWLAAISATGHIAYMIVRLGPVFRIASLYFPDDMQRKAWNNMSDTQRLLALLAGNQPWLLLELGLLLGTSVMLLYIRLECWNSVAIDHTTCTFT